MLRCGRRRPRKQACSSRTLTSSRQRFARRPEKRAVPTLYPVCQQSAGGALADCRVISQFAQGHVDWNSSGCGDFASGAPTLGATLRRRENEDNGTVVSDAHVDQWVGVEVMLCGRKSSIGEVGSTTSNVCGELRSVVAVPEREHLCASFSKNLNQASNVEPDIRTMTANRREGEEGNGVVPSWLSCRRNMTRKRRSNTSGGISDCHLTALIASLPKTCNHIGDKATSTQTIASESEGSGLQLCADEGAVTSVEYRSSEVAIPMEQSFASQESNPSSGQGSSLGFGQAKKAHICAALQRDAIQVCPTTPEKAQKRKRGYQDTLPSNPLASKFSTETGAGISDLCPSADDKCGRDAGSGLTLMADFTLSPYSVEFESSCNSTGIGDPGLNAAGVEHPRALPSSASTPAMEPGPFGGVSHVGSLTSDTLVSAARGSTQRFQTQDLPYTTEIFDMGFTKRREERGRLESNQTVGGTAIAPRVRKKYKPKVAKENPTHNDHGSRVQNRAAGNHGDSEYGRAEVVGHQIIGGGVQRDASARDSCTSQSNGGGNHTKYTERIEESRSSFYQDNARQLRIGEPGSIPALISTSPREQRPSSVDNACLTRNVQRLHPQGPFHLNQHRVVSQSVLCTSRGLEGRLASDKSEMGRTMQVENFSSSSDSDQMIPNSVTSRQGEFEVLSGALANRVLALLGLPAIGIQTRSTAGAHERSQASDFVRRYTEAALRKYTSDEGDFSSFCEEWSARSHSALELAALDAEMTAQDAFPPGRTTLDAATDEASTDFELFCKDHFSAGLGDGALIQALSDELQEYGCDDAGTGVRESLRLVADNQRGVHDLLCETYCGVKEPGLGECEQPNLWPSPVEWRPLMAQMMFSDCAEDRTVSSFYASTSAGVNNIMLSRLNEMIEQNVQRSENICNKPGAEKELSMMRVMSDCGQTEGSCSEGVKHLGLPKDFYYPHEEQSLVQPRYMITALRQLGSQFLDYDMATGSGGGVAPADQFSSGVENCSDYASCPENVLALCQVCPRLKLCPATTPFHRMTYVQLVAYIKIISTISSELSPLQLLRHVQDHLPEAEKLEFENLRPMILHLVNSEQLKRLADLADIPLPSCLESIQGVEAHDVDMIIHNDQTTRRGGFGEHNNDVADLVPYVGNAKVAYNDGHCFPLRRRKPRPKVYLDTETVRVWNLLMGKTETMDHDPDIDNEAKWKQARLHMREQAESFIQRMHLIQGDRSFSRWKGSVVGSVVGVFLTQNVTDVLSSSAFMCLRARFPSPRLGRPSLQSKSPGEHIVRDGPFTSSLAKEENMVHSLKCAGLSCTCCVTNTESSLTDSEIMMSSLESQPELQLLLHHETGGSNGVMTDYSSLAKGLQKEEKLSSGPERARMEAEQVGARRSVKWEAVAGKYEDARRQQAATDCAPPRTDMTEDGVDWEAVRCADIEDIADAIKERGMNWKLAGRIKGFLEKLRLEQGGIDLEWLRSIPSDDAMEFLSSVHGLGLKSVECIRLLALHHNAFPVDTNVGRICVRLGWVPLEPLPEELQLHVLELYPVQATIQKYLWPRLCTLDQQTLYELHYQLITFGKVFCTKSKPNCNACPMRSDCKHFASALSSAKLALPSALAGGPILALPPGSCSAAQVGGGTKTTQSSMCMAQYCQPIIEEPMTPEFATSMSDCDIEDYPFSVEEIADESILELTQDGNQNRYCELNLSTTLSEPDIVQGMDLADWASPAQEEAQPKVVGSSLHSAHMVVEYEREVGNVNTLTRPTVLPIDAPSREVVIVPPEAASIPVPKLKIVQRLRTVHYVYELPDNHPLLDGMDMREPDDPCFYLLAIWSPGEVPQSIPNINDDNEETSFASFTFPSDEESIKGTLLVPCRTATQGSFPLNGTYFQVNEVFADHESSLQPILVPRVLLWNLRRRFVYFGTSVTSILRGMTTEEIQACFRRGYVCVRGFDRVSRAPKPLVGRLHFQTTKSISKSATL